MTNVNKFDPSVLKPGYITDSTHLKRGLVTDQYVSGAPTDGDLKKGLLKADGNLRHDLIGSDGELRAGLVREVTSEPDPSAWGIFSGTSYIDADLDETAAFPFRLEAWVETPESFTATQTVISLCSTSSSTSYLCFGFEETSGELEVIRRNGGGTLRSTHGTLEAGWNKIEVAFLSTTAYSVYVNDELIEAVTGATAVGLTSSGDQVVIGALRNALGSRGFHLQSNAALAKLYTSDTLVGSWDLAGDATDSTGTQDGDATGVTYGP